MRILVLGGARFLGRHFVDAALADGHDVTVFTRGRTPMPWGARVTALVGNRDPRIEPGPAAIDDGAWDAVVDTSGYLPRVVRANAEALVSRVRRYLFVSSLSAIATPDRPGLDESAPVERLDDPATEEVMKHYGALKAACEDVVRETFATRATIVRPGLIVGPHDDTDRFGYWVARFAQPSLLGDRADRAVVPAPPDAPVQVIDVRDLARFMLDLLVRDVGGTFNACSPDGLWTMADVVAACRALAADAPDAVYVPEATLIAHGVQPWVGLPLWIPSTEAEAAGFMRIDCWKAARGGLAPRPLADTVRDTAAWLAQRDNAGAWKHVLPAERERAILAAVG